MASLTGTKIKDTYDGILKTTDNGVLGGTEKLITDGLGNSSGVYLGTSGNVGIGDSNTRSARLLLNNAGSSGAPQLMLIDSGDSGKQAELRFDSGNLIYDYWNGSSRSEVMRIDSSKNVGIGGTADSWAKLDVNGQSLFRGNAVLKTGQGLKFNNYFNAGTGTDKIVDDGYAGAIYLNAADGSVIFGNSSSSVIGGADVSITERVRILSTGGLTFNGDTAAANALDDYEEGTFTPSLTFGGGSTGMTFFDRAGVYTKIGRQVTCTIYVALTAKGSSTGQAAITSLPFANGNVSRGSLAIASLRFDNITYSGSVQLLLPNSSTSLNFEQVSEAGTDSQITHSNFNDSTEMSATITYFV